MKRAKGELFCGIVAAIIYCIGIIGFFISLITVSIGMGVIIAVLAFVFGSIFVAFVHVLHNGVKDDE